MFAVLAVVFAMSFVFLGVGSGGGALSDLWNGRFGDLFGGSSALTISGLEKKVAKDPTNAALRLQLAQLTTTKSAPADQQVAAYNAYLKLKPKNVTGLQGLATAYAARVQEIKNLISSPATPPLSALENFQLASSTSKLGQGLEALPSSLLGISSLQQGDTALAQQQLGKVIATHMGVYRRIWKLNPSDSGSFIAIAQTAEADGDTAAAIASYNEFLKRFPNDPAYGAATIKAKIKQLQASASTSSQSSTTSPTG